ncbi:MAG: hypothetical protein Ta2B_09380 [Termitinemataceae bacterium]|nr:MAG: hypothetical protein Ta2B_09380 [Termitinemataceae bacterium]
MMTKEEIIKWREEHEYTVERSCYSCEHNTSSTTCEFTGAKVEKKRVCTEWR